MARFNGDVIEMTVRCWATFVPRCYAVFRDDVPEPAPTQTRASEKTEPLRVSFAELLEAAKRKKHTR